MNAMKIFHFNKLSLAVSLAFGLAGPTVALAATTPPLGTAGTYGVLSSTFTRSAGITAITGDAGYTTLSGPGTHTVTGANFQPAPPQAGLDQAAALANLNGQACVSLGTGAVALDAIDIGGGPGNYTPGCYSSGGAMNITVGTTVNLNGVGTYIFRPNGAITTGANSIVALNGASACDVFWTPTGAATLGATSAFEGTVIAAAGITVGTTVTWNGRALAFGGTVTTDTDVITNSPTCAAAASAASQLLFPYVIKDSNRTTLVTVIGNGQPVNAGAQLRVQYWTKSLTAANTAACEPNSSELSFTDNDIVTFDTAGLLGPGPLFGDTTNSAPLGTSISYAAPRHGYLVVDWNPDDIAFAGSWIEIDLANGGAHGDAAIRSGIADDFTITEDNKALYVGLPDTATVTTARAVPFWPPSTASTVFTVTPLGSAMRTVENNQMVSQILNSNPTQGAYDRNENGIDGTVPQTVRCVGRLTAGQLMPGVVSNAAWAAIGGWGWFTNLGDGDNNYTESVTIDLRAAVYQVDTSSAAGAGKFMQNAIKIVSDDN